MKLRKRWISLVLTLILMVNIALSGAIQIFAHAAMLDVDYDNCIADTEGDGINEMWYVLSKNSRCRHISHETETIKYYFADSNPDSKYTWTTDVSASVAQEIKDAYANSMKKWNNVYFYSYDENNIVTKHKVINIVEGTKTDYDLIIYPITGGDNIATTGPLGNEEIIESGTPNHSHYSQWKMNVNVDCFYVHNGYNQAIVNSIRERNGAHEFGHVLGLRDLDSNNLCNSSKNNQHHEEVLMGYGYTLTDRASNITYKDIAGVAITRGFHTDNDHKWLNCGKQANGNYKLICTICNGVKEVKSLSGYSYNPYGACNGNHALSSGNMFATASYGNKDYYKCKYCRYVAPFNSIVEQNYSVTDYDTLYHKYVNQVNGLEYTFYEEHAPYVPVDNQYHRRNCACGVRTGRHAILASQASLGKRYATCMTCGYLIDLSDGFYPVIMSATQVSVNGSYITPEGIIILMDEDVQAYLEGTLTFYPPDQVPERQ